MRQNFIRNVANAQYLLCNSSNASVSAAITTAAAAPDGHLLLIAGDAATASALQASGLSMQNDLSGATIDTLFAEEPQILANLSATMFFFQDPSKSEFLADYAIFTRGVRRIFDAQTCSGTVKPLKFEICLPAARTRRRCLGIRLAPPKRRC